MSDTPQSLPSGPVPGVLLAYHLKALKLPTVGRPSGSRPPLRRNAAAGFLSKAVEH
jgi:hypothetical protein